METQHNRLALISELAKRKRDALTPQERDRLMQTWMAQARGPAKNLELACKLSDALLAMKRAVAKQAAEKTGNGL